MRLVVASGNPGKLDEIEAALEGTGIEPVIIGDLVPGFDPEETGETFLDNARLKAVAAFEATRLPSMADDSGLCVEGLGLEPGVRSSRYAGEGKTDAQRNEFLLQRTADLTGEDRRAYFACTVYAVLPSDLAGSDAEQVAEGYRGVWFEGRIHGYLGFSPHGEKGFGYDPIFIPDADPSRTLAQFEMDEKNRISHRGQALTEFAAFLRSAAAQPSGQ